MAEDEGVFHDEVEIEDFEYDADSETFTYPCPCGDLFTITKVIFIHFNSFLFVRRMTGKNVEQHFPSYWLNIELIELLWILES